MTTRPEVIAHRGASRERPENTLAAFARAADLGAEAVELDVHLTRDGALVVHHDALISGIPERPAIASLTLRELQSFRIRGEPLPTLSDVIAEVGDRVRIYCELKGADTAAAAVAVLAERGDRAAVHSFDHRLVAEALRLAPALARGVLETSYHLDPCWPMRATQARDLWQHESLIDQALVNAVHGEGGRVIAWTVNVRDRASQLAAFGVDGICTDDVAAVVAQLGGRERG